MRMGDKLKVATNLSDKDKDRISKNAGNGDSLVAISNDLYLSTFENLESNQRGADLTLMLAGGWIESVYLMSNMVKDFEKDKNTAERIVDQKLALENLIEFSAKYAENADVKGVSSQLSELLAIMNEVQSTENVAVKAPQNTGKIIIGGGAKSTLSKEQFEKLKLKSLALDQVLQMLNKPKNLQIIISMKKLTTSFLFFAFVSFNISLSSQTPCVTYHRQTTCSQRSEGGFIYNSQSKSGLLQKELHPN